MSIIKGFCKFLIALVLACIAYVLSRIGDLLNIKWLLLRAVDLLQLSYDMAPEGYKTYAKSVGVYDELVERSLFRY